MEEDIIEFNRNLAATTHPGGLAHETTLTQLSAAVEVWPLCRIITALSGFCLYGEVKTIFHSNVGIVEEQTMTQPWLESFIQYCLVSGSSNQNILSTFAWILASAKDEKVEKFMLS